MPCHSGRQRCSQISRDTIPGAGECEMNARGSSCRYYVWREGRTETVAPGWRMDEEERTPRETSSPKEERKRATENGPGRETEMCSAKKSEEDGVRGRERRDWWMKQSGDRVSIQAFATNPRISLHPPPPAAPRSSTPLPASSVPLSLRQRHQWRQHPSLRCCMRPATTSSGHQTIRL